MDWRDPQDQYNYFGGMRRKWDGQVSLFKALMDTYSRKNYGNNLEDGTLQPVQCREGECLRWKNSDLKGAVFLTVPTGEVCCQGNEEQQWVLYDILTQFTRPWDRPLELPKTRRKQLLAELQNKGPYQEEEEAPKLITGGPKHLVKRWGCHAVRCRGVGYMWSNAGCREACGWPGHTGTPPPGAPAPFPPLLQDPPPFSPAPRSATQNCRRVSL